MFGFGFLNAAFLLGLAAASVPIIIHLIHKRHSKSVDFPSLMFLRLIDLRMASRQRLRELIVLALRVAAIALFAFALAKPILRTRSASASARTSSTAVIVIDNSYSMSYKESGVTGLETAKEKAQKILDTLAPGDSAAIIPVAGYTPANAQLSRDIAGLSRRIRLMNESPSPGSLEGALDLALKALASSSEINKELYVLSDYQQALWAQVLDSGVLQNVDADIVIVDLSPKRPENLSLSSVEISHKPGQAGILEIRANVHNFSSSPMKARVALVLEGKTRSEESIDVPGGGNESISFTHSIGDGRLQGYAFLKTDGLTTDNKRFFASSAGEAVRVLVVNGDPSGIWDIDETYYLVTALSPNSSAGGLGARLDETKQESGSSSPIKTQIVTESMLRGEDFADYAAVILANVRNLDETVVSELEDFVREGGGLVIFSGSQVRTEIYNAALRKNGVPALLPCRLIGPREYEQETSDQMSLIPVDWEHPVFSALKGIRDHAFNTTHFSQILVCEEDRDDDMVSTLARFSNGFPALTEKKYGAGSVLFFASTCDRDWTNMPLRPIYLPLLHQMVRYIASKQQRLKNYYVGETVKYVFPPSEKGLEISVTDPAGRTFEASIEPSGGAISGTFTDTLIPGIYNADIRTSSGREGEYFAVNVDTEEGNLSRIPRAIVNSSLGPDIITLENSDDITSAIWRMRTGVKLWDYFFYLALMALLAEGWLANRFVPHARKQQPLATGRARTTSRFEKISVN